MWQISNSILSGVEVLSVTLTWCSMTQTIHTFALRSSYRNQTPLASTCTLQTSPQVHRYRRTPFQHFQFSVQKFWDPWVRQSNWTERHNIMCVTVTTYSHFNVLPFQFANKGILLLKGLVLHVLHFICHQDIVI